HVPGGAFPSYAHGYYPRSNAFYIRWDEIARDRESFAAWIRENVLEATPEDFARYAAARSKAA
ncbi:MAG TPA: CoA transferase subunit A, partial [Sinorhizobium sp.]|nr:CoA transferase subunit A [Sinorhizobium sp.]